MTISLPSFSISVSSCWRIDFASKLYVDSSGSLALRLGRLVMRAGYPALFSVLQPIDTKTDGKIGIWHDLAKEPLGMEAGFMLVELAPFAGAYALLS